MEKLVIKNAQNIIVALDEMIEELKPKGFENTAFNPSLNIHIKSTGVITPEGDRVCDIVAYIGGSSEEIIDDLDENFLPFS